jgi:hypothetical protein
MPVISREAKRHASSARAIQARSGSDMSHVGVSATVGTPSGADAQAQAAITSRSRSSTVPFHPAAPSVSTPVSAVRDSASDSDSRDARRATRLAESSGSPNWDVPWSVR